MSEPNIDTADYSQLAEGVRLGLSQWDRDAVPTCNSFTGSIVRESFSILFRETCHLVGEFRACGQSRCSCMEKFWIDTLTTTSEEVVSHASSTRQYEIYTLTQMWSSIGSCMYSKFDRYSECGQIGFGWRQEGERGKRLEGSDTPFARFVSSVPKTSPRPPLVGDTQGHPETTPSCTHDIGSSVSNTKSNAMQATKMQTVGWSAILHTREEH